MHDLERDTREWLEADGLGGFASGTVCGVRTRRYHALLLAATTPPTGRRLLVNGCDVWVDSVSGRHALSSQHYTPDVRHPDGVTRLRTFTAEPWPTWTYDIGNGLRVQQEIWVPHGRVAAVISWRCLSPIDGPVRLLVRPFLTGRDYHALHHENPDIDFGFRVDRGAVVWQPYRDVPPIRSLANASYHHAPDWYRNVRYVEEAARGLDDTEDVWAPGWLTFDLAEGQACWWLQAGDAETMEVPPGDVRAYVDGVRTHERSRRGAFPSPLHRAADAYIVRRRQGSSIVAGYPWFTDWGRDTFIALRGLCLATGRLDQAYSVLLEWAGTVSQGMVPNRFPDAGDIPEFNTADASLWFIVACADFLDAAQAANRIIDDQARRALRDAVEAILDGYARGTRFGIRLDHDGLVACGVPGLQLTWMDAKVGDEVVTPRIGKPVEIQALWLNALDAAASGPFGMVRADRWRGLFTRGLTSFTTRFRNDRGDGLFDVVDVDHEAGRVDRSIRPNQIFAVGGLRLNLLDRSGAQSVVTAVERHLLTPLGLRSLAPGDPTYRASYQGGPRQRDYAYHQGTVWPWLLGAFVDAWLEVHGDTAERRVEARTRFVSPLRAHLDVAGIGHVSEIADADPPHAPKGCPFQAWSLAELLRLQARVEPHDRAEGRRI